MIYNIDIHNGDAVRSLPPCISYETKVIRPGTPASKLQNPGVYLDVLAPAEARTSVQLPRDGQHIWVTNHNGDTLKHFQWPLADATVVEEEKEAVAV